jgi:moderate conductance mechanosensitive channel
MYAVTLPARWPELTLSLAIAFLVAYFIADFVAGLAQGVLRAVVGEDAMDRAFVQDPRRFIKRTVFLVTSAALMFPALKLAGFHSRFGGEPEALARWALDAGLRIAVIALVAYLVIRVGSGAARRFEREMSRGTGLDVIERTKRAKTLGRLLQKTLTIVVVSVSALMILRELRVDITPVLTGAGIVGLAVGFGAQTLVRDIISGFFLILEDQVRVGDVAVVNGQGGLVEQVNLRTIVLRDEQGTVHVFPNGEVKTLANLSKDFSYYVITIAMSSEDDPDRVTAALRDAGSSLMNDPDFRPHILEPLDIYGIDAFDRGQLILKARIKTVPQKQWFVGRELRKRIARVFREGGLDLPVPEMTVRIEGLEQMLMRADTARHTAETARHGGP